MSETPQPTPPRTAFWVDLALILALALLIGGPTLYGKPIGNHDVAAIGGAAERMLHGERLYLDRPEPNPPLAFLAAIPPVALARALAWDAMATLQVSILALMTAALAMFAWVCNECRVPEDPVVRRILIVLAAALAYGYDSYQIGQRDPMMLILALPYLAGALGVTMSRPVGGRAAVVVGVLGGLGLALKPHYLLFPIAVELVLAAQMRSLRALVRRDLVVLLAVFGGFYLWVIVGTAYVANVLEWKDAYQRYGNLGGSFGRVLERVRPAALLWAVPLLALRPGSVDDLVLRRASRLILVCIAAAIASVFIQGKGFTYHIWPVHFLSWLFVGVSAARWWSAPWGRVGVPLAVVGTLALAEVPLDPTPLFRGPNPGPGTLWDCRAHPGLGLGQKGMCHIPALIDAVQARTAPGDRIAVLAPTAYPFGWVALEADVIDSVTLSPILLGDLYAGTPTNVQPVPYHTGEARGALEGRILEALAEDLRRHHPALILVDYRPFLQGFGETWFDLVEFYRQNPDVAAILDAEYTEVEVREANGAVRFFVHVKATSPAPAPRLPFVLPSRPAPEPTAP